MACDRFYTFKIVTYNSIDYCFDLFNQSKHFCYILHDKDETDVHYHILATFHIQKSFKAVRNLVNGPQNTFVQACDDVDEALIYWTHINYPDKAQYQSSDIVYDNERYWKKRANNGEAVEDKNEMFVNDLMADDFTVETMARKYGRDFMKNYKSYIGFRQLVVAEREFKRKGTDYDFIDFNTY